jgi:phosphotransferase system HPr-like phosphotransfer protein
MGEVFKSKLIKENGQIRVEAIINLDMGFGTIRGMERFVAEAQGYLKGVHVKNEGDSRLKDMKSFFMAMTACAPRFEKLEFIVDGTDAEAERMALRLYSGVTSEISSEPNFGRFEKACPWAYSD